MPVPEQSLQGAVLTVQFLEGGSLRYCGPAGAVLAVQGKALVVDARTGLELLYLVSYGTERGVLITLDYRGHVAEQYELPAGVTAWGLVQGVDGGVYVGLYGPAALARFDTRERKFEIVHRPSGLQAGESVICDLAEGTDGRIYYGTYPDCSLWAFDPCSGKATGYGCLASAEMYLRYICALPDGHVLALVGCHRCRLLDVDPRSGLATCLTPEELALPSAWGPIAVRGRYAVHFWERSGHWFVRAYDWAAKSFVAEWPLPAEGRPVLLPGQGECLHIAMAGSDMHCVLEPGGHWECQQFVGPVLPAWPGMAVFQDREGWLVGAGSQEYFVLRPGSEKVEPRPIPASGAAIAPLALLCSAEDKLWGSYHLGQSIFHFDVAAGQAQKFGPVVSVGGEVYDLEEIDGRLYMASYTDAVLSVYDPQLPWLPGSEPGCNPLELGRIGHEQYRPLAGIARGVGGALVIGSMARYGIAGGAISLLDPAVGKLTVYVDPIPEQAVTAVDADEQLVYFGTSVHSNGARCSWTDRAFVGALDPDTGRVMERHPVQAEGVSALFWLRKGVVYFSAGGKLYRWEAGSEPQLALEPGRIGINGWCRAPGEAAIWLIINGTVASLDAESERLLVFSETARRVEAPIAVCTDGLIYCRQGVGIACFSPPAPMRRAARQ